jgi:hypothetical protein
VSGGDPAPAPAPQGAAPQGGVRGAAGCTTAFRIACLTRRGGILCTISTRPKARRLSTKATIRVVGRKARAVASGRGTVNVRLKGKVRRGARVEVRYTAGGAKGKAVVKLGKAVTVNVKR